jgi:hypothetical protein
MARILEDVRIEDDHRLAQYRCELKEGTMWLEIPVPLSSDSLDYIDAFFELITRVVRRWPGSGDETPSIASLEPEEPGQETELEGRAID